MVNPNQRKSDESFEDYRKRLREQNHSAKGREVKVLWPSLQKGTYVKKKHGPLTDE